MRVLQLIDSLEAGGAERMAVNLANALHAAEVPVVLVASRAGGVLQSQINQGVSYYCLHKRRTLDVKAFKHLHDIVIRHQITIIHAHSSSFFMGYLLKRRLPHLKLIWHDHYGHSEQLAQRKYKILKWCARAFDAVIAVNEHLAQWSSTVLKHPKVVVVANFVVEATGLQASTFLKGTAEKRIVCLANLRPQKDHFNLINAFNALAPAHEDWTLHLVGKNFEDAYSTNINRLIAELDLTARVFCYGSSEDIGHILQQARIGVLSSQSEGLPLALLEYGWYRLPVVATAVGDIPKVIQHKQEGLLVPAKDTPALTTALQTLMEQPDVAALYATELRHKIETQYTAKTVVGTLKTLYQATKNA